MMVFAALLRGINVGGNNKVDMKRLKLLFEEAGMNNVVTYINSGNIIFTTDKHNKIELSPLLEKVIEDGFGLQIKVLIVSMSEYSHIMEILPDDWSNDDRMKSDVFFLWDEAGDESVLQQLPSKPGIDRVVYVPRAVLWSVDRELAGKSGMNKVIGTPFYKLATVRNVNTVRKIYALMQAAVQ